MRNELITSKIGKPLNNNVLIEVTDIFNEFVTKSGVIVFNAAHEDSWADSKEYKISNFFIRHGKVISIPDRLVPDSFDFETDIEVEPGDIVYFNIVAFKASQPLTMGDRKFLLVHYKELIVRVRNGQICPINGYGVFSPVKKESTFGIYTSVQDKTDKWILKIKPEKYPTELNDRYYFDDIWEIGDVVYLKVGDKPFKLEGELIKNLPEELYCCPMRMIIAEV
jgi:co-chaperonin GroES (HSP10)